MTDILLLLVAATLVNHFVLVQLRGLHPLTGIGGKPETTVGIATVVVLTLSSACTYLLYHSLLLPRDLVFLRTPAYMLVIVSLVVLTGAVMQQYAPAQYRLPAVLQPLITTNSAVLGVLLFNDSSADSLGGAVLYGFGAAAGFALVLVLFSAMQERITAADVPEPFRGPAIALITAGLMSVALMGIASLVPP